MQCLRRNAAEWRRVVPAGALLLSVCFLWGCGSGVDKKVGSVRVVVTHDGEPVTEGSVQMVIAGEGKGAFGDLDATGAVSFENVETGNYTVAVYPPAPPEPDPEKPSPPAKEYTNIPERFRSEATSPLKAEVKEGANEFQFDLKEAA